MIPHENLAVAMAHGAYAMTGQPQAVMLHVNVGTANAINNIINLNRDNIPLILAAGRTPITEKGKFGGRNRYIHWGQEMFDQGGDAARSREVGLRAARARADHRRGRRAPTRSPCRARAARSISRCRASRWRRRCRSRSAR